MISSWSLAVIAITIFGLGIVTPVWLLFNPLVIWGTNPVKFMGPIRKLILAHRQDLAMELCNTAPMMWLAKQVGALLAAKKEDRDQEVVKQAALADDILAVIKRLVFVSAASCALAVGVSALAMAQVSAHQDILRGLLVLSTFALAMVTLYGWRLVQDFSMAKFHIKECYDILNRVDESNYSSNGYYNSRSHMVSKYRDGTFDPQDHVWYLDDNRPGVVDVYVVDSESVGRCYASWTENGSLHRVRDALVENFDLEDSQIQEGPPR